VIVSYRGPLAALKGAEQQIDTAAIEQELSARKIEQDLAELERLRRLDEMKRNENKAIEPTPPRAAPKDEPPLLPPGGAPLPPGALEKAPGAPG
jgi:hypothetical protein